MLPNFQPGDLWVHAAPPSRWKTTFLINLADQMALQNREVSFFCAELSLSEMRNRFRTLYSDLSPVPGHLRAIQISDDDGFDITNPAETIILPVSNTGITPVMVFDSIDLLPTKVGAVIPVLKKRLLEMGWAAILSIQSRRNGSMSIEGCQDMIDYLSTGLFASVNGFRLEWLRYPENQVRNNMFVEIDPVTRRLKPQP